VALCTLPLIATAACATFTPTADPSDTEDDASSLDASPRLDASSRDVSSSDTSPTAAPSARSDASLPTDASADAFPDHVDADASEADALDAAIDVEANVIDAAPEADVPTCDPSTDPTAAACLTASHGLFVSAAGSDTSGDGSPTYPFATVGRALHTYNPAGRIYICQGMYTERVALDASAAANLYGGFACPTATTTSSDGGPAWARGTGTTVFAPTTYDPANNWVLSVTGVPTPVTLQALSFVAPTPSGTDSEGNGNSSIVAVIQGSTATLLTVTLTAGRGVDGTPAASGNSTPNYTAAKAADGAATTDAPVTGPGAAGGALNVCADQSSSQGGNGGGSVPATSGTATPLPPPVTLATPSCSILSFCPVTHDGAAGATGATGDDGAYGIPPAGGSAASTFGTLSTTNIPATWTPTHGGAGGNGGPGQGGGGGGGGKDGVVAIGGGGGGSGGCGGAGGAGGAGGGASLALLSVDNLSLSLTDCTLITAGGGAGSAGGNGQDGQAPGANGLGDYPFSGNGGSGGNGAGGAGGAGGTGGISAGVLFRGSTAPTLTSCTLTVGDPGHGGAGGTPGSSGEPYAGLPGAAGFDEFSAYGGSLASVKSMLQIP